MTMPHLRSDQSQGIEGTSQRGTYGYSIFIKKDITRERKEVKKDWLKKDGTHTKKL